MFHVRVPLTRGGHCSQIITSLAGIIGTATDNLHQQNHRIPRHVVVGLLIIQLNPKAANHIELNLPHRKRNAASQGTNERTT